MSEAPKKIWVCEDTKWEAYYTEYEKDIPYIRADIVDELVEALNLFIEKYPSMFGYPGEPQVKIKRALAKLEKSHE